MTHCQAPGGLSAPESSRGTSLARTIPISLVGFAASYSGGGRRNATSCGEMKFCLIPPHAMKNNGEFGSEGELDALQTPAQREFHGPRLEARTFRGSRQHDPGGFE